MRSNEVGFVGFWEWVFTEECLGRSPKEVDVDEFSLFESRRKIEIIGG